MSELLLETKLMDGPGIYPNISEAVYRDYKAVNQSMLKECQRTLAHFKWEWDHVGVPREPVDGEKTEQLLIGTAIHAAVLEPEKFKATYLDSNVGKKNLKAYKDCVADNPDKIVLSKKEYGICQGILDSIASTETAKSLLEIESMNELSVVWNDWQFPNVLCKARIDRYATVNGYKAVIDLKSTVDASPEGFAKSIQVWGYHIQAAYYLDAMAATTGEPHKNFIIIAVEKEPPFAVAVYRLDHEDIAMGRTIYRRWLQEVATAMDTNKWPSYNDTISPIRLPQWAYAKRD